ncbi:hypothetical protein H5P28_08790 [Ruficoccus amylovorans]|uniref:Uncharacterized protein n=1 Tax=Ruficoccus amylovorans TaxID=1804625 RepID=A0A842HD50_9BACT|nr:hypothetical protein [Ruficoccus amylovorans]MBC2594352.1 hypothetical protein [Ruficoccus amylovorans]
MNADHTGKDPLERLLGSQPLRPSANFTEKTLARLRARDTGTLAEDEFDRRLDAWLAGMPLSPTDDFTEKVLASSPRPAARRFLGLPAWATAMVAALVIGGFTTVALRQDNPQTPAVKLAMAENIAPATSTLGIVSKTPAATDSQTSSPVDAGLNAPDESPDFLFVAESTSTPGDLSDLIMMQDALLSVAVFSDANMLATVDILVN